MPYPPFANHGRDRLILSRWLLVAVAAFTALAVAAALSVAMHARSANRNCVDLARTLRLSSPALIPSGRLLRHPETELRGNDWRFSPQLPVMAPGVEGWLLSYPKPEL